MSTTEDRNAHGIDILFCIGGDGTLRGAHAISLECQRRDLPISVLGVPKTVDNDVPWVDKTFGFDTAVEVARLAVDAAHSEARGARNGVGIVKLMGRDAGFIAAAASIASHDVNYCLVPEVPFRLEALLASCVYLVSVSYDARRLYAELDAARNEEKALATEFERLQAERQAQATPLKVERLARDRLAMRNATPAVTQYVSYAAVAASAPAAGAAR